MSFQQWKDYFQLNSAHFSLINFDLLDELSAEEKDLIYTSIQQFQRGENSEGKNLYSFAKKFDQPFYTECIKLFIKEEQTHARVLGEFMDKHQIPRIYGHWVDDVFRWLRKAGGIGNSITVLVTAEIISKVYYKGLQKATGSQLLQSICSQILKDEDKHIEFQCDTMSQLYAAKTFVGKYFSRIKHFILMTGTIIIVWWYHKRVLKKGRYYFGKFFLETLLVYFEAEEMIKQKLFSKNKMITTI